MAVQTTLLFQRVDLNKRLHEKAKQLVWSDPVEEEETDVISSGTKRRQEDTDNDRSITS